MQCLKETYNAFYTKAAPAIQETGRELIARLALLKVMPQRVLNLYTDTPAYADALKACYPEADIENISIYDGLDALQDDTYDLVFANQAIDASDDINATMIHIKRVMKVGAPIMFSSFGPGTTLAFAKPFKDMHDVGDVLLKTAFLDPVMDMEVFDVHYKASNETLEYEAIYGHAWKQASGQVNAEPETSIGLHALRQMLRGSQ